MQSNSKFKTLRGNVGTKLFAIIITIASSIVILIAIGLIQFEEYKSFHENFIKKNESFNSSFNLNPPICYIVDLNGFNLLTTPFASIIMIIFIVLHKRRSLCMNRCNWKNVGLPMSISLWSKKSRINSAIVYGQISFQVFQIFEQSISSLFGYQISVPGGTIVDPTGLYNILLIVIKVIFVGIRKLFRKLTNLKVSENFTIFRLLPSFGCVKSKCIHNKFFNSNLHVD